MALTLRDISIPFTQDESTLKGIAAKLLGIREDDIRTYRITRISTDARKKNDIRFNYSLVVETEGVDEARLIARVPHAAAAPAEEHRELETGTKPLNAPIVIAGLGPAGLFAAYTLSANGYRPIVIERGRPIDERSADVSRFWHGGALDAESNIMFGEGGAGTFSDGKLTTRIKDARAAEVISVLSDFGAPEEIRVMAKPHIGTDRLREVVRGMRAEIERLGGEVRFSAKLTDIIHEDGRLRAVTVEKNGMPERIECAACILAAGQGARDTYRMLLSRGVRMSAKPFAVGVRIEHPKTLIDAAQFGAFAGHPRLGAAEYKLTGKSGGRGVYSFCMCPGGVVTGASSGPEQTVTNGMSYYARDGENSNAAIVVQVDERDFGDGALCGLNFQEELERRAYELGGRNFYAPAIRAGDFLKGCIPGGFFAVKPTYQPGVVKADISKCLPEAVSAGLREGIAQFGRMLKGFDMYDAVLTAVESRTSSPVRIVRGETGEAEGISGLYPVGEGAGYAGGIVSAAVDGMRAAERLIGIYKPGTI